MTIHHAIVRKFRIRSTLNAAPRVCERGGTRIRLAELFGELGFNNGVEIGTHKGKYAEVFCKMNKKLKLTCVDPWLAYISLSQQVQDTLYDMSLKRLSKYNVTIVRKRSMEFVNSIKDESIDFVYIDGDHEYDQCSLDILSWVPKVKPQGIIATHDYYNLFWPGVTRSVDAYIAAHNIRYWYVTREKCSTAFWVKE